MMTDTHSTPSFPKPVVSIQHAVPFEALTNEQLDAFVHACLHEVAQQYELDYSAVELTIRFCSADESQALNTRYRQQNQPTNVLTFAYGVCPQEHTLSADIILCVPVLEAEATQQKKTIANHTAHLCVHGVLHALGFDHIKEEDAQEMESLEIEVLKGFHISNPYA